MTNRQRQAAVNSAELEAFEEQPTSPEEEEPASVKRVTGTDVPADLEFDRRALIGMGDPKGDIGTCCFAAMEMCGGCGGISKYTRRFGLRTGPVLEIKKGWDLFAGGVFM